MNGQGQPRGALACFEGGDGAGKSTLASAVFEELCRRGESPVLIDKKSAEGFDGPYLGERMKSLRAVLWDYPQEAPLWEWGDPHWFHLIVSWFSLLDRCRIQPLLREGRLVIVDNWYYKFAARFLLKHEFCSQLVHSSFYHLTEPDVVVFVDVDPRVAVTRRERFSATESGRMDGAAKGDRDDFVVYQGRVLDRLRAFATSSWVRFDASHRDLDELVGAATEVLATAWSERSQSNGNSAPKRAPRQYARDLGLGAGSKRGKIPVRSQLRLFGGALGDQEASAKVQDSETADERLGRPGSPPALTGG